MEMGGMEIWHGMEMARNGNGKRMRFFGQVLYGHFFGHESPELTW